MDALGRVCVRDGVADVEVFDPRDADDVAGSALLDFDALESGERQERGEAQARLHGPVSRDFGDRRVDARTASEDAPDADAPNVLVVVDRGNEELERTFFARGLGHVRDDRFEERFEIVALVFERALRDAELAVGEEDREIGLLVAGAQFDEEVERFVDDFLGARVLAVDLVDDDDRFEIEFERLAEHETRLRHHAFGGVHEQQHALDHLQHAFDLAAEIRMARRVHDVELYVPVADRRVLGKDRDAAFAFERIRVHDARRDVLPFAKDAALFEHGVHEGRLAVIDVSDNGDVSEVWAGLHGALVLNAPVRATFTLRAFRALAGA